MLDVVYIQGAHLIIDSEEDTGSYLINLRVEGQT